MTRALLLLYATLLAACALGPAIEAHRYFVLEPQSGTAPIAADVHVAPTTVADFYDTQDIVYSRSPGTRAYYRFNHWTERPQRSIHAHLSRRLGAGRPGSGLVLRTHLEEIYHDAVEPPGAVRITVSAELVRAQSDALVARRTFSHSAPAASYDAPGAVHGFRRALGALLDDLAAWVAAERSA